MLSLFNFLSYLFSNKKTLVYNTHEKEDCSEVIRKLNTIGVHYRVAINKRTVRGETVMTHKIYVKKADEHKALHAMYHG